MHPIEQLRFVARAGGPEASLLVREAASALTIFESDPAGLLTAARRLLTRQPAIGPLWSLCARLVVTNDLWAQGDRFVREMMSDTTPRELAYALGDDATVVVAGAPETILAGLAKRGDVKVLLLDVEGQGPGVARMLERSGVEVEDIDMSRLGVVVEAADAVLVEASLLGETGAVVDVGALGTAAAAQGLGTPVYLVAGYGRRVHEQYWQAASSRLANRTGPSWTRSTEIMPIRLATHLVTVDGVVVLADDPVGPVPQLHFAPELLVELG